MIAMNRLDRFNHICNMLGGLAYQIEVRGGLNLLDGHVHSEDFYTHLLNLVFDWKLENENVVKKNIAGLDLVDRPNKIVTQVSATATKQKIESALRKLDKYTDYNFKFMSISKDASELRSKTFSNPHALVFSPADDIFDIGTLLAKIKGLSSEKIEKVYQFLKSELISTPDPEKLESNITALIKILAQQEWNNQPLDIEIIPFDIEGKILHNKLGSSRILIDDYKVYYHRIEKIYSEFDKQGVNKSISVLNGMRSEYLSTLAETDNPDERFFSVAKKIKTRIVSSVNYTDIPEEELDLSIDILVVDAFIRCKIFATPGGTGDADSR